MGKDQWMHVPSLDKMSNDTFRLFLGSTRSGAKYPMLNIKPVKKAFILYNANLKDRSNARFREADDDKPIIDTALRDLTNKLIFKSAPLKSPLIISGSFKASLLVSVNKKDMDLLIDFYEQTPDGKYFF